MTLNLFFFCLAVVLTAVVLWLYITGRLEGALDALRAPQRQKSEQECEAERAATERRIKELFAPLDRLADRPAIQRIVQSKTYTVWVAPAVMALYVAFNLGMIIAALIGVLHWSSGVLSAVFFLAYLMCWRVLRLTPTAQK